MVWYKWINPVLLLVNNTPYIYKKTHFYEKLPWLGQMTTDYRPGAEIKTFAFYFKL